MRDYEIVYIFAPSLEEAQVTEKLDRYHGLLTGANGGEITETDHWGRRQLAYEVERQTSGYYVVEHFRAPGEALPEFERALKLDEGVLRYLVTLFEHEVGAPPMTEEELAAARRRDDDDDDEE